MECILFDELISWLCSLSSETQFTKDTVFVGRCIGEALNQIDSSFFNDQWLAKIASYEPTANWRVKANNLRKIYRRLAEFYTEQLSIKLDCEWDIDVSHMVENNDDSLMYKFLQLLLAAALLNPNNRDFVSTVLNQPQSVVEMAMKLVGEFKSAQSVLPEIACSDAVPVYESALPTAKGTCELMNTIEQLRRELSEQNERLNQMWSERDFLQRENDSVKNRIEELSDSGTENETLKRRLRSAQAIKESTQESLYKLEAERDHLKELLERSMEENSDLKSKISHNTLCEEENRRIKDELEELHLRLQEREVANVKLESYKSKMKDYKAMKLEVEVLEGKLSTYMQSAIELEDEKMKNGVLKTCIESVRLENTELNGKLREEIRRGDKTEFECRRLNERLAGMMEEIDLLRAKNQKFQETALLTEFGKPAEFGLSSLHDETLEAFKSDDRILKLELENERLRQLVGSNTEVDLLKSNLDSLTAEKLLLESELRLAHQKNVETEARLNEVNEILSSANFANDNKRAEHQANNEKLGLVVAHLRAKLNQANCDLEVARAEKKELQERIGKLEIEFADCNTKLKRYMAKARRVIIDLEEKSRAVENGALSRHEFDSIRKERDTYKLNIEVLKENIEKGRVVQEEEQRLITTYAYHLMMRLQHTLPNAGQSQLSMQPKPQPRSLFTRLQNSGFDASSLIVCLICMTGVYLWSYGVTSCDVEMLFYRILHN